MDLSSMLFFIDASKMGWGEHSSTNLVNIGQ